MPIELACDCGWTKPVKDEYAGKRVKCPGCSNVLQVPQPLSLEDIAGAQLLEDDAPLRPEPPRSAQVAVLPKPSRPTISPSQDESAVPSRRIYAMDDIPTTPQEPIESRKREIRRRTRKISKSYGRSGPRFALSGGVASGFGLMLLGGLLVIVLLAFDRISIYGVVLIAIGFFRMVASLLGHETE